MALYVPTITSLQARRHVGTRGARRRGDRVVDDGGVFRVAVADHELDGGELSGIFEVHDQVLDCLGDPGVGGMRGGAEYTDASVGVVDGGEGVLTLPGEGDGLDEVHREDGLGLGVQEGGPGDVRALGRGIDAFGLEDFPDGGGRQLDAEEREFAVDAPVAPGGVFFGEAEYEAADGGDCARAAGTRVAAEADVTVIHEVAVPAQDGSGETMSRSRRRAARGSGARREARKARSAA